MLVLGVNHGFHDPSAALLDDGALVAMVEQERICRRKRAPEVMPVEAIRACLDIAGARAADVEAVGVGWDVRRFSPRLPPLPHFELDNALPPELARPPRLPVTLVPHHLAHAASGFWSSGFADAALLVVDGQGELESTTIAAGGPDGIHILRAHPIGASLGHFYRAATQHAGLERPGSRGEGKLMGLAAYGRPTEPMPLAWTDGGIELAPEVRVPEGVDTRVWLRDALRSWWTRHDFPYAGGIADEPMAYANFAASAQHALEEAIAGLAAEARRLTGSRNLVVTGGVAQNCSANGELVETGLFDRYWFLPVAHDPGVSLGAALHVAAAAASDGRPFRPARLEHAFWGLEYDEAACADALRDAGLVAQRLDDGELAGCVARHLAEGRVVGWFQGRAEVGARALGARSILADPRQREIVARLNRIKGREIWRPLAPSVLAERFDEYFDAAVASPFMNVRATVWPHQRSRVPAVVHVDGSARPQAVDARHAPRYRALIAAFERLTGVPIVLNTSFNLAGEPIVHSPRDAVRTFIRGGLDVLALERFLVVRPAEADA